MLKFIDFVYSKFGLRYEMFLSTRPQKYLGELAVWDEAERQLAAALDANKVWFLLLLVASFFDGIFEQDLTHTVCVFFFCV